MVYVWENGFDVYAGNGKGKGGKGGGGGTLAPGLTNKPPKTTTGGGEAGPVGVSAANPGTSRIGVRDIGVGL